ncbi:MAG: chitobiase/beta-hexosaminidase C-terminal domain-containing protein, partial [bacterium]
MKKIIPYAFTLIMAFMFLFSFNSYGQTIVDIAQNGDFENWTGGDPDNWLGARSSISAANVVEYTTAAHSGTTSCQLINTSGSHVRFTTQALSIMADTEYTVTYYVRGQGEIRNAFYRDGAYSAYSDYTVVDSDAWTEIVYTFQHGTAVDDVEVIFSLINTSDVRDHLQIDNVTITYELPETPELYVDKPEIDNLMYVFGNGPSASDIFEVSGINLDGSDVLLDVTGEFEISLDNIDYYPQIDLPAYDGTPTDVYVRLNAGLAVDPYAGSITISGGGATDIDVSLSGQVVESFAFPYANDFRLEQDIALAQVQGFTIIDAEWGGTAGGGYTRVFPDGYIETPSIDFTSIDFLEVEFAATTYGGASGQTLSVLVSANDGVDYELLESFPITADYVTYSHIIDLTDVYNVATGKVKIQMTAGGASTRFRDLSMAEYAPMFVETPTFDPNGGTFTDPVDVTIATTTPDATVYYSTDSETGPWTEYTAPVNVAETTTIWAYASDNTGTLGDSEVASATFEFASIIEVANITDLRAGLTDGTIYRLTGEAILTYQQAFRNKKWLQDADAGIEIYDDAGVITTVYEIGDGITGLTGTLGVSNGMLQLTPTEDPGAASTTGNTPVVVTKTLNELTEADQARLVLVENASFDISYDGSNFATGTNYDIADASGAGVFRTEFWDADYIDEPIPMDPQNITAIVREYNGTMQITSRSLADFEPYVSTLVETPTFDPNGGTFTDPVDVTIATTTPDATVYYSTDSETGPWTEYTAPVNVAETTTIWAYASDNTGTLGDSEVASATFEFASIIEVANITDLRAGLTDGTIYRLTGEAILTYQQAFRNKKWVQDADAGIEIDDNSGIITTVYEIGDGITGITGTLSRNNEMLQITPTEDPGAASTTGNTPVVVTKTLNELTEADQARLVLVENASF